jgi:hypothetical protein
MNDTGILVAGRSRSEERTLGERAKLESFFPKRLLAVRLVAAAKTRETMRGRTSEPGGVASMWMYAMAISGSMMVQGEGL